MNLQDLIDKEDRMAANRKLHPPKFREGARVVLPDGAVGVVSSAHYLTNLGYHQYHVRVTSKEAGYPESDLRPYTPPPAEAA